jgi:hypothetical protein
MESMSLRDMCFWVCLASFETGMFVTFEQHTEWGIALMLIGLGGMVGCAWPHIKTKNWQPKYLWGIAILTMLVLSTSVVIGLYHRYYGKTDTNSSSVPPPTISAVPKEHHAAPEITMTQWGCLTNGRMFADVQVNPPIPSNAPFHMMLIWRVVDNAIDELEDVQIEKSTLRSMSEAGQTIELAVSQDFLQRAYRLKMVHVILVVLPGAVAPAQIMKLSDVTRLGGQIGITNGFVPNVHVTIEKKGNAAFRPTATT